MLKKIVQFQGNAIEGLGSPGCRVTPVCFSRNMLKTNDLNLVLPHARCTNCCPTEDSLDDLTRAQPSSAELSINLVGCCALRAQYRLQNVAKIVDSNHFSKEPSIRLLRRLLPIQRRCRLTCRTRCPAALRVGEQWRSSHNRWQRIEENRNSPGMVSRAGVSPNLSVCSNSANVAHIQNRNRLVGTVHLSGAESVVCSVPNFGQASGYVALLS